MSFVFGHVREAVVSRTDELQQPTDQFVRLPAVVVQGWIAMLRTKSGDRKSKQRA
jgi:hypothetical protein